MRNNITSPSPKQPNREVMLKLKREIRRLASSDVPRVVEFVRTMEARYPELTQ